MDKQAAGYPYNRILLGNKKKYSKIPLKSMIYEIACMNLKKKTLGLSAIRQTQRTTY